MNPTLPNLRTDLPADHPKHPFLLRVEQRRADMVQRVAEAQMDETTQAGSEPETRPKARASSGTRLPPGIYRGTTFGTFRADAGRDPVSEKRRRKDGFSTVAEAVTWRERSMAADSVTDLAVVDFTAKLPLAFGKALWDVRTRLETKQIEADRKANKLPACTPGAMVASQPTVPLLAPARQASVEDWLELPKPRFEFTPELLVEMAAFWLQRHPKGQLGITFDRAAKLWLLSKRQKNVRPRTYGDCKSIIDFWTKGLGARRCADLTTADLEAVLNPKRTEVGPIRVRNLIAKLSDLFSWLQALGELAAGSENNPAGGLIRPIVDEEQPDPFNLDEASALLSLAIQTQEKLGCVGYIAIGLFGGPRFTEMTRLKWGEHLATEEDMRLYRLPEVSRIRLTAPEDEDDADDDDDDEENDLLLRITPDVAKKRRQRLVQLPPNLCAILLEMEARGWIRRGEPVLPPERKQKLFRRFTEANGIPWKDNGLRSAFGSHYFAATGSLDATIAAMGHTGDAATFRNHYFKLVSRKAGRRYFKLGFQGLAAVPVFPLKVSFRG